MSFLERAKTSVSHFLHDRRGAVVVAFAVSAIPVLGLVGASVDYSRAANVQTQLQGALDTSILTVAHNRDLSDQQIEAAMRTQMEALVHGAYGATGLTLNIARDVNDNLLEVNATLSIDTSILQVMGIDEIVVGADAAVSAEYKALEVALVLDNTGSMARRMSTLRSAAQDFVDVVTEDGENSNTSIALVPYVASVNIGNLPVMEQFIDMEGESEHHADLIEWLWLAKYNGCNWPGGNSNPWDNSDEVDEGASLDVPAFEIPGFNFDRFADIYDEIFDELIGVRSAQALSSYSFREIDGCFIANPTQVSHWQLFEDIGVDWKGCVEARPEPYDVLDTTPDPSNPDTLWVPYFWYDDSDRFASWVGRYSNDWIRDTPLVANTDMSSSIGGRTLSVIKYTSDNQMTIDERPPSTRGPNMSCGDPIIPLTNNHAIISDAISDMSHWYNGGTQTAQGVAWGWRALSPTPPFTEGLPYDEVTKVMVIMTDGENWLVGSGNDATQSDYSAYGHLRMGRMGQSTDDARQYIDSRTLLTCANAKAAGITVYTVTFGLRNRHTREVWDECASEVSMAYHVDTSSELVGAFNSIAEAVGDLRLTQ